MKVVLINGSARNNGTTDHALSIISREFEAVGIETRTIKVGGKPVMRCTGCQSCRREDLGRCIYGDGLVNEVIEAMEEADAMIVGTPVHYAAASGAIASVLGRVFYAGGSKFAGKAAASVVVCRRAGGTSAFDQLNKFFTISQMPVASSQYWNVGFGNKGEELDRDEEGVETMKTLAANMIWMLRCIEAGKRAGISHPRAGGNARTNFIR